MRLDKYLTDCFLGTRKEAKTLIKKGLIKVNDKIIIKEDHNINESIDIVTYNGNILKYQRYYYYLLNKPKGYICANQDDTHHVVMELFNNLPKKLVEELLIVGRLDLDTEGMLIITNDGNFVHTLTSPNSHIEKVYYVEYDKELPDDAPTILENPVILKNTTYLPSKLVIIDKNQAYLTIKEGQFHQVKRMIHYLGSDVTYLKRVQIGNLKLPDNLPIGKYIELTQNDLKLLIS